MKLAIFGASVSLQTRNHVTKEITGYVPVLQRDHQKALGLSVIQQICYEGNRLSDGGLARLVDVEAWKPDICLFEPQIEDTRRGTDASEGEFRMVYRRLLDRGILPVTLLLPTPHWYRAGRGKYFQLLTRICKEYALPVIAIDIPENMPLDTHFNGVHTRLPGAEFYAAQVATGLAPLMQDTKARENILKQAAQRAQSRPVQARMRTIGCPGGPPARCSGLSLTAELKGHGMARIRLVQKQQIGMFSPVITTSVRNLDSGEDIAPLTLSVWDDYCHYDRISFVTSGDIILPAGAAYRIEMRCTEQDPDYATCRREVANWPDAAERHLRPRGPLFGISDTGFEFRNLTYHNS